MSSLIGKIAGLGTSFSWSFGSIFFTISSRRIGADAVNRLRLAIALFFVATTHLLLFGQPFPSVKDFQWFWLGLSGFIGFTIGDTLLFRSFVLLGPRLTMLLMSLVPVFGTLIAWLFLNEVLGLSKIGAISITLIGISWAVWERREKNQRIPNYKKGILLGIGAAFCQALGLFASKKGLVGGLPAISGNLIRLLFANLTIWTFSLTQRDFSKTFKGLSDPKTLGSILAGAVFGPFLGVGLSLVAIQNTNIGTASTLMALPPVILIPLSHWFFKEKITLPSVFATLIAFFGVALIFSL